MYQFISYFKENGYNVLYAANEIYTYYFNIYKMFATYPNHNTLDLV